MSHANQLAGSLIFSPTNFPLRIMRMPSHHQSTSPHRHDFTELVIILDGAGKHQVGDELYSIGTGDVFVLLGDMAHSYPETRQLYVVNILLDPQRLGIPTADLGSLPGYHGLFEVEPLIRHRDKFPNRLRLTPDQLAAATRLIAQIEEELDKKQRGYRFMATAYVMQLIGYLSRCYSHIEPDETRPVAQISRLLGWLERHYAEDIRIADMMKIARMSQTSLMRTFRQIMGRSPADHLIRLRIAKAQELLRRTTASVGDVARHVGFRDSNYLARQFRRITGKSPRQYRLVSSEKKSL